jgi:hypothetical protein
VEQQEAQTGIDDRSKLIEAIYSLKAADPPEPDPRPFRT